MTTRQTTLRRFFIAVAVLLGIAVAPSIAQSAASNWTTAHPFRVLDTRPGQLTIDGKFSAIGKRSSGSTLELQLTGRAGMPDNVDTVMLNITTVDPAEAGFITVYPCDTARPLASNVNYAPGTVQANLVAARVDGKGRACIYTHARTDLIADVQSYTTNAIRETDPSRLLDTRSGNHTIDDQYDGIGKRSAGSTLELQLTGRAGISDRADTVMLNITTVEPSAAGFITVYPCDSPRPNASNVNYLPGTVQANLVVARVDDAGRTCIYTHARTHIVADVQGYTTSAIRETEPSRLLDSRSGNTTIDSKYDGIGKRNAGSTLELQLAGRAGIPSDANTVLLNVTTAEPEAPGFIAVFPCNSPRPNTSNVNYVPGSVQANRVVARVDNNGRTCIYTHARTHIVADVQGYIVGATMAAAPEQYTPPASASGFVHPGVLVDGSELDEIRAHVAAGDQPWAGVVDRMYGSASSTATAARPTSYRFSSLSYVPAPVRVIQASSSGNQSYLDAHGLREIGDVEHIDDARAAYTQALLWNATGNRAHADKAIEIMNAWSSTLTEIKFDQPRRVDNGGIIWVDGKLHAGWGASLFARSAEIIRYTDAGWSNPDIARFEDMLRDVYLPLTIDGWSNGANWMMTLAEGTISIGVFTNDRATFNAGVAMWRDQAPTTIYLPSDGARPLAPVSWMDTASEIDNYWRNPDRYVTGLQGETLRDLSHMVMGLGAMANTAETAYIQGVDLYGEQATRIVAGFELNAGYVNAYLDETNRLGRAPSSTWTPPNWPGGPGTFNIVNTYHTTGWNVAHHHYTTRTNTSMPQTSRLVQRINPNTAQPAHHLAWEPLTHS